MLEIDERMMESNYQPNMSQNFKENEFSHGNVESSNDHDVPTGDLNAVSRTVIHRPLSSGLSRFSEVYRDIQKSNKEDSVSVVDQDTKKLSSIGGSGLPFPLEVSGHEPNIIERVKNVIRVRLQDPQPEGLLTRGLQTIKPGVHLGSIPVLAVTMAFGLLSVSFSYYFSVENFTYEIVEITFLGGLLLLFTPVFVRILSRVPSRLERICLLCILSVLFFLVQFMCSPLHFAEYDESLHWRTANNILNIGHLFTANTMLPVSPYYPGLEIVTNAVSTITGLDTFYSGNVIIIASHILIVLGGFLLYEKMTNSSRMASIAIMIYVVNSHFLFFDAFYSYESLALPLAVFMIYIIARYDNEEKDYLWVKNTAWIVLIAVNVTHHMTSYVFDGMLVLWSIISLNNKKCCKDHKNLFALTIFSLLLSMAYAFLMPGNPVWGYLFQFFSSTFHQLGQIIAGTSKTRPLFSTAGRSSPIWDRLLMTGSVAIVTFSLPFGMLFINKQHRSNILAVTLGILSLLYPITQAFRFTEFGAQITDRASAFLFLSVAYVLTVLITHFWPTRKLSKRASTFLTVALAVIFLGGVIVEAGPALSVIPGPYVAEADARSIEPQGINAALWSLAYLGPNNRVATDRVNQMLLNTYGNQRVITYLYDRVDVSPIFYSKSFDSSDANIVKNGHIHYLEVDLRISTIQPLQGTYFEVDRPTQAINRDALMKFGAVVQFDRLFDSGNIVIYDTGSYYQDT